MTPQLYIASIGLGMWTSDDLGETLVRMGSRAGMYSGYQIWALASDPSDPNMLYAGTNGAARLTIRILRKWSLRSVSGRSGHSDTAALRAVARLPFRNLPVV